MSESPLKIAITEAMKNAMRAKDKERLGTVRLILAEIKKVEVDERINPDDSRIISIMDKMVKQRRESIKQYVDGGRQELADKEQAEIDIIQEFLPQPLTDEEIDTIIAEAITSTGASSMQDMGKVMGTIKGQLTGRADMGAVSQKIKTALG